MAGSIRQRGKASWQLRVHSGRDEHTGEKLYVNKTVRGGRREAERELARLVAQVEDGVAKARSGTVGDLCEKWFEQAVPGLSPAVAAEYRRLLDRRILPKWGSMPLRRLRTSELDGWYAHLRKSGGIGGKPLSPNSVNRVHAILRRALNQAVKWGWINSNPAAAATPPRVHRQPIEIPTAAEIGRLIEAAAVVNHGLPVFLRLAATTGARRGELCALRWRHLDLDKRQLHIAGALVQVKREVIEKSTKTHAERRVSLDAGTVRMLEEHRCRLEGTLRFAGATLDSESFVFSHDPEGLAPWRPGYVTLAFVRLSRQQDLEGLRLHDLRHFAATTMIVGGVDIRTAAGRLGHAQSSTTLDVYAQFVKSADAGAADALGEILDGAIGPGK